MNPLLASMALAIVLTPLLFLPACGGGGEGAQRVDPRFLANEVYDPGDGPEGCELGLDGNCLQEEIIVVPGPPLLMGAMVMFKWSRRLRRRIAQKGCDGAEVS